MTAENMIGCVPVYAMRTLERLEKNGHEAYLVGGCVRDLLLGRKPLDWDITTSASCDEVMALFPRAVPTGLKYGTVTVPFGRGKTEVTTFRADGQYLNFRHPESVSFASSLTEDLGRRDFTVNAMAMDMRGAVTDIFGGAEDLEQRVIRCVGDAETRFSEDALRMLRALRFSAVLGFAVEERTVEAIAKLSPLASGLSAERVCAETQKMLMSDAPETIETAVRIGLYDAFLTKRPDLCGMREKMRGLPRSADVRWCVFVHALVCLGAVRDASDFLRVLRLDSVTVKAAGTGVSVAACGVPSDDVGIKQLLSQHGKRAVLCAASCSGARAVRRVRRVISGGECFSLSTLKINGDILISLGVPEGRETGKVLRILLDHVIVNPSDNTREKLIELAERHIKA